MLLHPIEVPTPPKPGSTADCELLNAVRMNTSHIGDNPQLEDPCRLGHQGISFNISSASERRKPPRRVQ